jgi:hypothetical protein
MRKLLCKKTATIGTATRMKRNQRSSPPNRNLRFSSMVPAPPKVAEKSPLPASATRGCGFEASIQTPSPEPAASAATEAKALAPRPDASASREAEEAKAARGHPSRPTADRRREARASAAAMAVGLMATYGPPRRASEVAGRRGKEQCD